MDMSFGRDYFQNSNLWKIIPGQFLVNGRTEDVIKVVGKSKDFPGWDVLFCDDKVSVPVTLTEEWIINHFSPIE